MLNPWDLKTDDSREADAKPTFIIFCEDEVSEPNYFKFFETSAIKVNTIPRQKNGFKHIINAIKYCLDAKIISNNSSDIGEGVYVWCVFDRDKANNDTDEHGNIDFDGAIEYASSKGFKVAWSNDCFELWVFKNRIRFINIVREAMIPHTQVAFERARALEIFHNNATNKPSHQKAPCTLVHHLVDELLRVGGKKLTA